MPCVDRELLAEYESTQARYREVQSECDRLEKEIRQQRSWAEIDREKSKLAGVEAEANRYNRHADDYEANVNRFKRKLEPLSEQAAERQAMLTDIESRFLVS